MHFSISCGLSFMCVTALLFLPAQAQLKCANTSPLVTAAGSKLIDIHLTCCMEVSVGRIKEPVSACYEQRNTYSNCKRHAYIFMNATNYCYCVDPHATWLKDRLQKLKTRGIDCKVL